MMRMNRELASVAWLCRAALAVVVTLSLAACGGIPTSGSVEAGPRFGEETATDTIFNPIGPAQDADQRSILEGFIAAFTGTQGDYAVAREFLSSSFKTEWEPRKSVLIRTGAPLVTSIGETAMEYTFNSQAQLDEFGAYTTAASARQRLSYTFVQEDGQWRISQAPNGIVLAESTFLTIFAKHSLYFYDLSLQYLVPDARWFSGGTTATRIVSALLAGVPDWLKGAAISQIPDGTQLSPGTTVTVDSSIAQVDLSATAGTADTRQRQLMQLQISESLSTVAGIGGVELSAAGQPLNIQSISTAAPVANPSVDARPLVLTDGEFGYYAGGSVTAVSDLSTKVVDLNPSSVTLGTLGTAAAVLNEDGVHIVRTGQVATRLVDSRAGLVGPSLDDYGYAWSVPGSSPNAMVAFDFDGAEFPVATTLPTESSVISFAVSRDNARIAILLQTAFGVRLIVAGIVRDPGRGFMPTSIGSPVVDLAVDDAEAIGVTWVDSFSVAMLTSFEDDDLVTSVQIGGQRSSLGRPEPATTIVGGNGVTGLRLLGVDHILLSPRGSSWQTTSIEADLIATQR